MKSKISIIVPIYKVEAYLKRCLDSIVAQTYQNLEIILVDDGSPDDCGKICDAYAEKDERIRVIHKENSGLGYARNSGLEICTGEYIMFLDSDDWLSTDCVEILHNRLIGDNSDMAVGNYIQIYDDGSTKRGYYTFEEDCVLTRSETLGRLNDHIFSVMMNAKLYKRTVLKSILFPSLGRGEDTWVLPDIMRQCNSISFVNKTVYYYYQRSDSIMHSITQNKLLDSICANLRLSQYLLEEGLLKNALRFYVNCIDYALSVEKTGDRLKYFKQYFDKKTRKRLLKETDWKTKVKWYGLFIPYSNRIRSLIVKIKKKFR